MQSGWVLIRRPEGARRMGFISRQRSRSARPVNKLIYLCILKIQMIISIDFLTSLVYNISITGRVSDKPREVKAMKITIFYDGKKKCFIATGTDTAEDGTRLSKSMDIESPKDMTIWRLYDVLIDDLSQIYLDMKSPLM